MKKYILLLIVGLSVSLSSKGQTYEAVFNKIAESYTVNGDGSSEYRYQKELKLNTHMAFNSLYGETFIVYNPAYQTLKINESYTKQADGTIIKAPNNAFNPSLPSFAVDAPAYNKLTEMVVTHTGLELGCTIYLDYTIITKAGYQANTDFYHQFKEYSPIKEYQLTVTAPGALFYEQTVKPNVQPKKNGNTYTWNFKDIPAILPEQNVATVSSPYIFVSTIESNETRVKTIVDQIVKAAEGKVDYSGEKKDQAITQYVTKQVGSSQVPLYLANKVRSAQEVAKSAYGTATEKAALMINLCKEANISTDVVLAFPKNVPPSILNLSGVYVKNNDQLVSPLNGNDTEIGKLSYKNAIYVNGNQLMAKVAPEQVTNAIEKNLNEEHLEQSGTYQVYTLPAPKKGFDTWNIRTLNTERKQAFEIPNMLDETDEYTLTLPEGSALASKPYTETIANKVGEVKVQLTQDNNKIKVIRSIKLNEQVIPTTDYAQFRALVNLWNNPAYKSVILKK